MKILLRLGRKGRRTRIFGSRRGGGCTGSNLEVSWASATSRSTSGGALTLAEAHARTHARTSRNLCKKSPKHIRMGATRLLAAGVLFCLLATVACLQCFKCGQYNDGVGSITPCFNFTYMKLIECPSRDQHYCIVSSDTFPTSSTS